MSVEPSATSQAGEVGTAPADAARSGAVPDFEDMLYPDRVRRIEEVLSQRTRHITLVLEKIFDPHNAAACLRTAEGFGIQGLHVVEGDVPFVPSHKVYRGASKWLDVTKHQDTASAIRAVKDAGYRLAVTDFAATTELADLDVSHKVALAFGNEHYGASRALIAAADVTFRIPMLGFTQSFNVSVAVALALQDTRRRQLEMFGSAGDLDAEERERLRREWIRASVRHAARIERCLAAQRHRLR